MFDEERASTPQGREVLNRVASFESGKAEA
jgi:hypothetical protein